MIVTPPSWWTRRREKAGARRNRKRQRREQRHDALLHQAEAARYRAATPELRKAANPSRTPSENFFQPAEGAPPGRAANRAMASPTTRPRPLDPSPAKATGPFDPAPDWEQSPRSV